jgi:hypothetical protein
MISLRDGRQQHQDQRLIADHSGTTKSKRTDMKRVLIAVATAFIALTTMFNSAADAGFKGRIGLGVLVLAPHLMAAHKSRSAIHIEGMLGQGEAYAGFGFAMTEPAAPYDVSKYKGVSFLAKAGQGSTTAVRFKIPDGNTDPTAGVCTECYNDFGINFAVTTEWTRYTVLFSDLKQEDGWGAPNPVTLDTKGIRGMQWQTANANQPYDLWFDDISFVGCE